MKIQIAHLYPEKLNLYGDRGNIASMVYRLKNRGIECEVKEYNIDDNIDFENIDIIYLGGGTDKDQAQVRETLLKRQVDFKAYVENGGAVLAVCGSYEMLGKYCEQNGKKEPCLDILNMYTVYGNNRQIGNIVLKNDMLDYEIVGFENHSGAVYSNIETPLGKVINGFGNDGKSGVEGAIYKNVVATYIHGPLLPKNPKLCDFILSKAIERKYGNYELPPLDDTIENDAHNYAVKTFS